MFDLAELILNFLATSCLADSFFLGPTGLSERGYLWYKPHMTDDPVSWKAEAVFGQAQILEMIHRLADSQPQATAEKPYDADSPIVRLDVIDMAFYRMLNQHPELLRTLDWRAFERLLADLLERCGYEIELQRGTKDGGVDLFAIKSDATFGPQRYLLQAKRWKSKVGVEPVRQLAFLHSHYGMTKSCLATTASFTRGALELGSQYQWQLELRDFEGIKKWVGGVTNKFVV